MSMTTEHSAQESLLSARILLPFCYRFCHTFVRLETKVGESVLKSSSLKWKKEQGFPRFSWLFEFAAAESRPPSQSPEQVLVEVKSVRLGKRDSQPRINS